MAQDESNQSTLLRAAAGRRGFLGLLGLAAIAALPGCGTLRDTGDSGTERAAGRAHLDRLRAAHGLQPLVADGTLEKAALEQSAYMARSGRMEHDTGLGRDFASRIRRNGIKGTAAENLAHGGFGTEKLFAMWMNSSGHRRNMLNPDFGRFGLAYTWEADRRRRYWALVLAR